MNRQPSFIKPLMTVLFVMLWTACSGSSSSSSDDGDASDTGSAVTVSDLSTLPDLDLDSADVTSANFAAPLNKSVADGNSTVGATSQAGCYAINFMKPTAMAQLKQAEMFKCYIEKTQDTNSELVIPTDSYGHYIIDQGAGSQGPRYVAARVGNFTVDSTQELRMEACSSTDGSSYSKMMEMSAIGNISTKTWSGHTTSHIELSEAIESPGGGDAITGTFNNTEFTIVMSSAEALTQEFDIANVASLTTTSTFGRNPDPSDSDATSATAYDDGFQVSFDYDLSSSIISGVLNTVTGTFSNGSSVTGIVKARFNDAIGAAQMNYSDSGAPESDFNSSEAFSVSGTGDSVTTTVVDETGVTYATLYDYVAAENIASEAITVPDNVTTAVAWQLDWDCTAPEGTTPTTITISSQAIYVDCDALSAEIQSQMETGTEASCFGGGGGGESEQNDLIGVYTSAAPVQCPADFASNAIVMSGGAPNFVATGATGTILNIVVTGETSCQATLPADGGCTTCSIGAGPSITVACPRNEQICNMTLTKN